jgi:transcriptional regulator with XRE-family HTH domain
VETIRKQVGTRLRELRKRAGFRAVEPFAELLKVHPNTVYDLERGTHWLSPEMAEKYVSALHVPLGTLVAEGPLHVEPTTEEAINALKKALSHAPANDQERELLRLFRALKDDSRRNGILKILGMETGGGGDGLSSATSHETKNGRRRPSR